MWLSDLRLVLPDRVMRGAIAIEDGVIADLRDGAAPAPSIDCGGLLALPGFVDMHGDMIEKEVEPRPNVRMPMELGLRDLDRRLAAAGVTTAYAAVSFHPRGVSGALRSVEHSTELVRGLGGARDGLAVDHRLHARFEVTFPEILGPVMELAEAGLLDLVSLMDHTPGQGQYRDLERHVASVAAQRGISGIEARQVVQGRIALAAQAEPRISATVSEVSGRCRALGIPLASHDDDTARKVRTMQHFGVGISEFPVTREAAAAARQAGMAIAMGAPNALRGESYSGNLSAREAHAHSLLDILASDYHPSAILPAVLTLAAAGSLPAAVALATANPARALGLDDRGEIATGRRADLVLADDTGLGRIRCVLRGGEVIHSDGWAGLERPALRAAS